MEPNGEEGPSPADRPDPPEEGAARPQVAYPFFEEEEEFDDEPPGAYLEEGRLGARARYRTSVRRRCGSVAKVRRWMR